MVVKAADLDNPERGMDLSTREAGEEKPGRKREDPAAAELKAMRERIAAAKATTPRDPIPHCGDCFRRGWEAAVRAVDG